MKTHYIMTLHKAACGEDLARVSPVTGIIEKVSCEACLQGATGWFTGYLKDVDREIEESEEALKMLRIQRRVITEQIDTLKEKVK